MGFLSWYKNKMEELENSQVHEDINYKFNVRKVDGVNYIYYGNVRVSSAKDDDGTLLDRLEEIRNNYLKDFEK